jgi:hypothetical protein
MARETVPWSWQTGGPIGVASDSAFPMSGLCRAVRGSRLCRAACTGSPVLVDYVALRTRRHEPFRLGPISPVSTRATAGFKVS